MARVDSLSQFTRRVYHAWAYQAASCLVTVNYDRRRKDICSDTRVLSKLQGMKLL